MMVLRMYVYNYNCDLKFIKDMLIDILIKVENIILCSNYVSINRLIGTGKKYEKNTCHTK
jgi:hypothetical protein